MFKRVVVGVLLTGLIGVLVAGAIVRTVDKTGTQTEARGVGPGRGDQQNGELGTGQGPKGGARGEGSATLEGGWGTGQRRGSGTAQAQVEEWLTVEGAVLSLEPDALTVQTADGQQVVVENRPWWFALEQGFSTQVGHTVTLTGFYEGDAFAASQISDSTNGQNVQIRDESGRPLWAGRGRRSG